MKEKRSLQGNTDIQGNVAVSRNVTAGGNANIQGNLRVGHNLKVEGWLDAKNIKGPMKGLYATAGSLRTAYPRPLAGWYALVGDNLPAELYRAEAGEDGKAVWTDTGETAGDFSLSLEQVEQDMESMMDEMLEVKDKTDHIDDIDQRLEAIEGRVRKDAQGQVELSDIGEVSARHTTGQVPSVWRVVLGEKAVAVVLNYSDPFGHAVVQEMHTTMIPGESGCLTAAPLDSAARVYTRSWCLQKETWSPWEESPRMSHVAEKADKGMFVTLSEEEYDALAQKDEEIYYFIFEE